MKQYTVKQNLSDRETEQLVLQGDAHFEKQMTDLTEKLLSVKQLRFVGITGPTCSGKTTAAKKLIRDFSKQGKTLHILSVDDFYYEKEKLSELSRKKGREAPDYDSEETIDTELLRTCTESLMDGRTTLLPHFDFKSGKRVAGEEVTPKETDLFLFEGIQILYPSIYKILGGADIRSVYIAPQSEIKIGKEIYTPNELRLMRRLVRDFRFRNTAPAFTFFIWKGVRANEDLNIFPRIGQCEFTLDSTMPYEVGMLKPFLEILMPQVFGDAEYGDDAERILQSLKDVQTVSADLIAKNSLYKEFI